MTIISNFLDFYMENRIIIIYISGILAVLLTLWQEYKFRTFARGGPVHDSKFAKKIILIRLVAAVLYCILIFNIILGFSFSILVGRLLYILFIFIVIILILYFLRISGFIDNLF